MTSKTHGKVSVLAALIGNTFVTIIKVIAATMTMSASMFAESVHSFADTLNQSLLLIGLNRSRKPADHVRGYGYGIERFFWSLISACGILFIGSGITIYHSITSLLHGNHGDTSLGAISVVVLLLALIVESITLYMAVRELKGGKKFSRKLFEHADPVTLAVVYEDSAAVLGVIFALIAQVLAFVTGNSVFDALGGIFVGILLGVLAMILITKNYQYIIGKPLDEDTQYEITELLLADPCIEQVTDFKSVAVDVGKYRIYATVEWNGTPLYEEIYDPGELQEEFDYIKDDFREFTKLMFKTTDRIPRLIGTHINTVEKRIVDKYPQIAYVDIEIN